MVCLPHGAIVHCDDLFPPYSNTFIEWQKKQPTRISPHKEYISSPEEYHRFAECHIYDMSLVGMDSLTNSFQNRVQIRKLERGGKPECGHTPHASARPERFCPVCQVEHRINFLNAISEAWAKHGGPWPVDAMVDPTYAFAALRSAWIKARLRLLNLVERLKKEELRQEQFDNRSRRMKREQSSTEVHDARMALARFQEKYSYPPSNRVPPERMDAQKSASLQSPKSEKAKKTVRFAEGVMGPSPQMGNYYKG